MWIEPPARLRSLLFKKSDSASGHLRLLPQETADEVVQLGRLEQEGIVAEIRAQLGVAGALAGAE